MPLSNNFSPERHVRSIFEKEGEAAVKDMILGAAEMCEVWHLGDISGGVTPEDFLRSQSLVSAGLTFLFARNHKGRNPTQVELESSRLDVIVKMRKIMRGNPLL